MGDRLKLLREWVENSLGLDNYSIEQVSEDASFRRYFRLNQNGETSIIMDAPPEKEDCRPFIDISKRLLACGVNVPEIKAMHLEQGFLLLTDLGTELYLQVLAQQNAELLYQDSIKALITIQTKAKTEGLLTYDETLLRSEMNLFQQWLLSRCLKIELDPAHVQMLEDCFNLLITEALQQPRVFVHRD